MLARLRKSAENKDSGFTLIELLVVMIIIGILAAIAIPAFLSQKTKARETSAKSDATSISQNIAAAIVDGPLLAGGTGAVLSGTAAAPIITLKYAVTTPALADVVLSTTSTTDPIKLTQNNKINKVTGTGSDYCVEVQAFKDVSAATPEPVGSPWRVDQAGLAKGTC